MGPYPPRVALAQHVPDPWDWGFHTVRGGVDPIKLGFCPRGVGVVDIWKDVWTGMGSNPLRVRRDWGVSPRSNSRRARLAL